MSHDTYVCTVPHAYTHTGSMYATYVTNNEHTYGRYRNLPVPIKYHENPVRRTSKTERQTCWGAPHFRHWHKPAKPNLNLNGKPNNSRILPGPTF